MKRFWLYSALGCLCMLAACASPHQLYQAPVTGTRAINPYHVNLHWMDYLKKGNKPDRHLDTWLRWYLDNLNYPDQHGLTGTIYDYTIYPDGRIESLNDYDSADSYASSFLILLQMYLVRGGELELNTADLQKLADIAWVILTLQNPDGTIRAKPGSEICYLMNNSEAYAGLIAYQDIATRYQLDKREQFLQAAFKLREALFSRWLNGGEFYWALSPTEAWSCNPQNIYPDRLAQFYPIAYGLLDRQPLLRQSIWTKYSLTGSEVKRYLSTEQGIVYAWAKKENTP